MGIHSVARRCDRSKGQLVHFSIKSCAPIYLYGSTDFTAVPQLSCYKSVSVVFFVISNTRSSPVPFVSDFLGYHLADLCYLGQEGKLL